MMWNASSADTRLATMGAGPPVMSSWLSDASARPPAITDRHSSALRVGLKACG